MTHSLGSDSLFYEPYADRAVRFFESLRHTKGTFYGEPFALLPWEKTIVRDVYGTIRASSNGKALRQYKYVYVEVPKKNGKSELAAGFSLFQTFADGEKNGEVYGCASDKSQASIVFDVAVDMIDQLPALRKRTKLNLSQKKITDRVTGTFYKVVSAEAYTKHGLNVSACIFDELHAQPNRELWDVMTFGAGDARLQPIWIIITTAGDDPDRVSVGWEQHEKAQRLLAGDIVDPTFYPVIYNYEGEDIYNPVNWAAANPSLGATITVESVQEAADKAKNSPSDERLFRWLRLNQWITTKLTGWLPISLFDATAGTWEKRELLGRDCYIGLDLSTTTDLSAVALIFPPQQGQADWRVLWESWIPEENMKERVDRDRVPYDQWAKMGHIRPTPGDWIDYELIEERIIELSKLYRVKELAYDPAFAVGTIQKLMQAGITCVPIKQYYNVLTDPMNKLEVMLGKGEMSHEKNPVARWCFGNTSISQNGNGEKKFVKETRGKSVVRTKRIDLTAAWITGMCRALTYESNRSVYEKRGIRVL